MTPEQFLTFADPLPEPMLLVLGGGLVLAGNQAVEKRLGVALHQVRGKNLADVVADSPDDMAHYLLSCSRSRSLVLGSLTLLGGDGKDLSCRTEGTLLRPRTEGAEAILLLRLFPKESSVGQSVVLNQRIEEFGKEIERWRRAEGEAREHGERLRVTLQSIGDGVITTDLDGRVAMMNPAAEQLTGWTQDEAAGLPLEEVFRIVNETSRQVVENPAMRALREGSVVGLANHAVLIAKDGTECHIDDSTAPVRHGRGPIVGSVLVFRDITEQRRGEEALRESEARLRLLADTIPQLAWIARPDGHIIWYNRRWYEYTGTKPAEMEGWGWLSIHDPTHLPDVLERWKASISTGEPFEMAFPLKGADASFRLFLTRVNPLKDSNGRILYWFGTNTDIEEQRQAQEALVESERQFHQLADVMPQIVWSARRDGQIDYMNRQWTKFTGLPETVGNQGWESLLHPDEAKAAGERWAACVRSGEPFDMELRLLDRATQFYRWHLIRTVAVKDQAGAVVRWFGTATDIHQQKLAEESSRFLAEASAALASVVDYESTLRKVATLAVPYFADWSAVDMANGDGTLRRLAVAHQDPEKIALVHRLMQEYPPDPESPTGAFAVLRNGKPQLIGEISDEMLTRAAKDERHLNLLRSLGLKSYLCVPLVVSGKPIGVLTFATAESGRTYSDADLALANDLANRAGVAIENLRLYQALRDADRRKDEFLATLAHELRNPLAPIRNSLQILKMPRVDAAMVQQTRDMMERQVHHLVRLVDDLLDVSRVMRGKIELRNEWVELATVVARAVETLQPFIEAQGHRLDLSIPNDSLLVHADPVRLAQVIGNLLTNAAKYTEVKGHIWLTAAQENGQAVLRVRDNGIGIAPEMLPHVFELFIQVDHASTKAQGGLGIGLTLVKNLIEMHGGIVEAHSAGLGKGCEFVVRMPLAVAEGQPSHDEGQGELQPEVARPAGHRLLVIDDNKDVAVSLSMLLELQGHEVRVAHSGPAALEMTKTYVPDAVFLDIGMPGMDGYEVARRLREQPGLENVVLAALTGWGQQEDRRRTADAGFNHHLVKPPELQAVAGVLSALKRQDH